MVPYERTLPSPADGRYALRALVDAMSRAMANGMDVEQTPPRHLRDHLRVLWKHRRLALMCFAATILIALLVTLFAPRKYTASMRIQVARQAPIQLRVEDSILAVDQGDRSTAAVASFIAMQAAALESRDLAARVIRKHRLTEYARDPSGRTGALLDFLRPRGWRKPRDAAAHREDGGVRRIAATSGGAASNDTTASAEAASVPPRVLDRYMDYLAVRPLTGTDIIEVRFTTPNPTLSAFLAGAHTQAYMEANDEARRGTDVIAKQFLTKQIREATTELERAETALGDFATEHPDVVANQEQKTAGDRIAEHSRKLAEAQEARATLESQFKFLTDRKSDPLAYFLDQPGIAKLRSALADARAQRASLAERLGPNHPQMIDLRQLENELDKQLRSEVSHEVQAVRSRYNAAKLREEGLERQLVNHQTDGVRLRALGARYDTLKSTVDRGREHQMALLKQEQAVAASANLAASSIRIIERAEVPERPSQPKVPLTLTLGVMAGALVAIGAAFGRDYFDDTVRSSEEIERTLQLPALAAIPSLDLVRPATPQLTGGVSDAYPWRNGDGADAASHQELVMLHQPFSPVAEAFRSMRTAVLFCTDRPARLVVVTSACNAEGKTVASVNLAAALAELGGRVLLVDADLRRPKCHRLMGVDNACGLSTTLVGDIDPGRAIQATLVPGLSLLSAGPSPTNAADLVGSDRMHPLIDYLRPQYDFIVIDTPPVLAVTDAVVLARAADRVVLVVKGHATSRELVRQARDRLLGAGVRFLGVAVNGVGPGWGDYAFYDPTDGNGHGATTSTVDATAAFSDDVPPADMPSAPQADAAVDGAAADDIIVAGPGGPELDGAAGIRVNGASDGMTNGIADAWDAAAMEPLAHEARDGVLAHERDGETDGPTIGGERIAAVDERMIIPEQPVGDDGAPAFTTFSAATEPHNGNGAGAMPVVDGALFGSDAGTDDPAAIAANGKSRARARKRAAD